MKLIVTKQKIILGDKSYNLEDIDFIMLDTKIRLYKSNGAAVALVGGFNNSECYDLFLDIAYSLIGLNKNFIFLKDKVINLSNIKGLETSNSGVFISTYGYELHLSDLSAEHIKVLKQKHNEVNSGNLKVDTV